MMHAAKLSRIFLKTVLAAAVLALAPCAMAADAAKGKPIFDQMCAGCHVT